MKTQITIRCPSCLGFSIKKNGWKIYGKQNYQCKDCHRQFIHETELSYQGCKSDIDDKIRLMLVRGCSIADIVVIEIGIYTSLVIWLKMLSVVSSIIGVLRQGMRSLNVIMRIWSL